MKLSSGFYRNTKSSEIFLNGLSSIDRDRVITGGQVTTDNIYNGNISWMVTDLAKIGEVNNNRVKGMQAMLYQYDQLHRIVQSKSLVTYAASTGFAARTGSASPYDEDYTYDPNGNILTLQRNNETGSLTDDFHYQYYANTNKLREVKPLDRDKVITGGQVTTDNILYRNLTLKGNAYTTAGKFVDIKALENIIMDPDFDAREGSDAWMHIVEDDGTYQYDAVGNLIKDQDQGVRITWTPYGKVREVHTKGDSLVVDFRYDATGNRVSKSITIRKDTLHYTTSITRYLRDAGGNVMAIYKDSTLTEQPIYGSSRLGQYKGTIRNGSLTLGERKYELSNHLGNVLSVITDNINIQWDSAWATVSSAVDYYPFGLEMKGRVYNDTTSYRYGFNGKEKDDNGEFGDLVYDYGFRIYNPKIAKFLSVDPLTKKYLELTPYQFASNTPIWAIDVDGLEAHVLSETYDEKGNFQNSSFKWDENASPVKDGQLHYNKTVGNKTTSSVEWAGDVDYGGGTLNPTPAPSAVLGTKQYYTWRNNDFNVRQELMDTWNTWQPSSPDYYMDYGDKYVNRFSNDLRPQLSESGKQWLDNALINLQTAIEVKLQVSPSIEIENSAFQKFAFDSHVSSYENAGLFKLPITDLVKIGTTPDVSDLFSPNGLRQLGQVTSDYVGHAKENPVSTTVRVFEFGFSIYKNIRKRKSNDKD